MEEIEDKSYQRQVANYIILIFSKLARHLEEKVAKLRENDIAESRLSNAVAWEELVRIDSLITQLEYYEDGDPATAVRITSEIMNDIIVKLEEKRAMF